MDARKLGAMYITLSVDALGPESSGIGRYTWELCKGLADRNDLTMQYFARGRLIDDPRSLLRGEVPKRRRGIVARLRAARRRELASSLFHGPNYFLPPGVEGGIITVHDLSAFRFPETHPAERVAAFESDFADSLRRAAHVITDTDTVRREVLEAFTLAPDMVTAVALGVDRQFRPMEDAELSSTLELLGLVPRGYGLCVSTLEPRKNIEQLLSAWERIPLSLRSRFPLVLAGGSGWRNETLRNAIARGVEQGWLRYLGFVDEDSLPSLYAGAALFAFPSSYEGFGLPPLEAMASGVPVLVSNRSCLPEVCGHAPRYIDPDDVPALADAIQDGLENTSWRSEAIVRGLHHAKKFSWDRCVDGTVAAYHRAKNSR